MRAVHIICCAGLLASCSSAPDVAGPQLPATMHADLIFVGRLISSEPAALLTGDVLVEAQMRTFEAVDQPGASIVAYDQNICQQGDLGDKALLVFLRRNPPSRYRGPDRPYYVYACPVVDAETVERVRRHEVCFRPDPPDYFCPKR